MPSAASHQEHQTDVVVIGAGPVGLFAVFQCGMLSMKCHVVDALDEIAGDARRLMPASGIARRNAMRLTAVASGTMDKAVWAYYEGRFHPAEKIHEPWIRHNEEQVMGGLGYLDSCAAKAGPGWLDGGGRIGQADISAVVAIGFANRARPNLGVLDKFSNLAAFAARCEAIDEFSSTAP